MFYFDNTKFNDIDRITFQQLSMKYKINRAI